MKLQTNQEVRVFSTKITGQNNSALSPNVIQVSTTQKHLQVLQ